MIYAKLKGIEKPHCLLVEFNHTQYFEDKAGRSKTIRGSPDFVEWKMALGLHDIECIRARFKMEKQLKISPRNLGKA